MRVTRLGLLSLMWACTNSTFSAPEANPATRAAVPPAPSEPRDRGFGRLTDTRGDPLPLGAIGRLGSPRLRHEVGVVRVAWTDDGARLVTQDSQGEVRVWDGGTGRRVRPFEPPRGSNFALSQDGAWLAVDGPRLTVIALASGASRWTRDAPRGTTHDMAFSPDGAHLAIAVGAAVQVLDAVTGRPHQRFGDHPDRVERVAYAPDGSRLASVDQTGLVLVRDRNDGALVATFRIAESAVPTTLLAFTPDSARIVVGADPIEVRDARTGRFERDLAGMGPSESAALIDARTLLTTHRPPAPRSIRWDLITGDAEPAWPQTHAPVGGAVAVHGDRVAVADTMGGVHLHALTDGRPVLRRDGHIGEVSAIAVHPAGHRAWTGGEDGRVLSWDLVTGTATAYEDLHPGGVQRLAVDASGSHLISGGWDGRARVWNPTRTRAERVLAAGAPAEVGWRHDGLPVTHSAARGLIVWHPNSELQLFAGHAGPMRVDPTGRRAVVPDRDGMRVVSLEDGAVLARLEALDVPPSSLQDASWSHDGTHLAVAAGDGRAWIVDAQGQQARILSGPPGVVTSVAWSPRGDTLATAHQDGARLWSSSEGGTMAHLRGHDGYTTHVAWMPDGRRLATASTDGTVLLWDTRGLDD